VLPALIEAVARNAYRRNVSRIQRRLTGRRAGPWMRPQEEAVVREILTKLRPMRCLEWGAGLSTLQFPDLLPPNATWLAIEHDAGWAEHVRAKNTRSGVTVAHVPADRSPWEGDGDAVSFGAYLRFPQVHGPFDFILIDGRARAAALETVPILLAEGGVVVLHDANRPQYLRATHQFLHQLHLTDARAHARRPSGGVWLGSLTRPLASVLDTALHERLWRFYSGIGRVFA
jgi:predicted O-methyltransferase YrrM